MDQQQQQQQQQQTDNIPLLCCFDKFKDSIDGESVGKCVLETVKECFEKREGGKEGKGVVGEVIEMADGGDGFLNVSLFFFFFLSLSLLLLSFLPPPQKNLPPLFKRHSKPP